MQRVLNYVTNPQHRTTVLASLFGLFLIGYLIFRYVAPFGAIVTYQFTALSDKGKLSALNGVESGQTLNTSDKGVSIPKQLIRKNIVTFNLALLSKKIDGIWVRMKFTGNPKLK